LAGGLRKAWATFSPRFNPRGSPIKQAVHVSTWGPVALLALAALVAFRRRWRELLPIPLCALLLAAQSAIFFGHSGYRTYLDPLFIVLAAGLVASRAPRAAGTSRAPRAAGPSRARRADGPSPTPRADGPSRAPRADGAGTA
jgi:MYXO-CTERM domain-containing protein